MLDSFAGHKNGAEPEASLIDVNGVLYGTTFTGGTSRKGSNAGTVFSIDPSTGAETVLYSFCGNWRSCPGDGRLPAASLIDIKGKLYGTTSGGGVDSSGTVFLLKEKR